MIWGEPGNNAQHSFFQMLHQGTPRAALDFLLPAQVLVRQSSRRQNLAIANCLAQAEAFAVRLPDASRRTRARASASSAPSASNFSRRHKVHAGNRPSSIVAFSELDARTLGSLVALYEHKVFTQSVVWGINAFDQWGVELGKKLAEQLAPAVTDPASAPPASPVVGRLLHALDKMRATS